MGGLLGQRHLHQQPARGRLCQRPHAALSHQDVLQRHHAALPLLQPHRHGTRDAGQGVCQPRRRDLRRPEERHPAAWHGDGERRHQHGGEKRRHGRDEHVYGGLHADEQRNLRHRTSLEGLLRLRRLCRRQRAAAGLESQHQLVLLPQHHRRADVKGQPSRRVLRRLHHRTVVARLPGADGLRHEHRHHTASRQRHTYPATVRLHHLSGIWLKGCYALPHRDECGWRHGRHHPARHQRHHSPRRHRRQPLPPMERPADGRGNGARRREHLCPSCQGARTPGVERHTTAHLRLAHLQRGARDHAPSLQRMAAHIAPLRRLH